MEQFEEEQGSLPSQANEIDVPQVSGVIREMCDIITVLDDLIAKVDIEVSKSQTVEKCEKKTTTWMDSVLKKLDDITEQLSTHLLNPSMVEEMCNFRTTLANIALEDLEFLNEPSKSPESTGTGPTILGDKTKSVSSRSEVGNNPLMEDEPQPEHKTSPVDLIVETVDRIVESQAILAKRLESVSISTDTVAQVVVSTDTVAQVVVSTDTVALVEGKDDAKQSIEIQSMSNVDDTQKGKNKKKKKKGKEVVPTVEVEEAKNSEIGVALERMMKNDKLPENLSRAWTEELNGDLNMNNNIYGMAIEHYQTALLIAYPYGMVPHNVPIWKIVELYNKLGRAYEMYSRKSYDEEEYLHFALACYKMVLKLDVINISTRSRCVNVLHKLKQYTLSIQESVIIEKMTNPIALKDSITMKSESTGLLLKTLCYEQSRVIETLLAEPRSTFLTSDFVNLWVTCQCNDPIAEDILSVRRYTTELSENQQIAPIHLVHYDRDYLQALHAISRGRLVECEKHLKCMIGSDNAKQKCEAYLFLSIAYSRLRPPVVHEYLEGFLENWDKEVPKDKKRRQKMIVRYVSVSRAVRADPFAGEPIINATPEMLANMYLQEALIIYWRRYDEGLGQKWWQYTRLHNEHKRFLTIAKCLADKSLKYKPECRFTKVFRNSVLIDLKMLRDYSKDNTNGFLSSSDADLDELETEVVQFDEQGVRYNPFADLLLLSTYLNTKRDAESLILCRKIVKGLLVISHPLPFVMAFEFANGDKSVLKRVKMLLASDVENYRAQSLLADIYGDKGFYGSAHTCLVKTLINWPCKDTITGLKQLIARKVRFAILCDAQRSLCQINRFIMSDISNSDESRIQKLLSVMKNISENLWD